MEGDKPLRDPGLGNERHEVFALTRLHVSEHQHLSSGRADYSPSAFAGARLSSSRKITRFSSDNACRRAWTSATSSNNRLTWLRDGKLNRLRNASTWGCTAAWKFSCAVSSCSALSAIAAANGFSFIAWAMKFVHVSNCSDQIDCAVRRRSGDWISVIALIQLSVQAPTMPRQTSVGSAVFAWKAPARKRVHASICCRHAC